MRDEKARSCSATSCSFPSTRPEKRVQSFYKFTGAESHNVRPTYNDGAATRLMTTLKPLRELAPSEDVIDIKPEPDDLIDEDPVSVQENPLSQKNYSDSYIRFFSHALLKSVDHLQLETQMVVLINRLQFQQQQNSVHAAKQLDVQSSWVYETGRLV